MNPKRKIKCLARITPKKKDFSAHILSFNKPKKKTVWKKEFTIITYKRKTITKKKKKHKG